MAEQHQVHYKRIRASISKEITSTTKIYDSTQSAEELASWIDESGNVKKASGKKSKKRKGRKIRSARSTSLIPSSTESSQSNSVASATDKEKKRGAKRKTFDEYVSDQIENLFSKVAEIRFIFAGAFMLPPHEYDKKKERYLVVKSKLRHLYDLITGHDNYPVSIAHVLQAEIAVISMDVSHQLLLLVIKQLDDHLASDSRHPEWLSWYRELSDAYFTHHKEVLVRSQDVLYQVTQINKNGDEDEKEFVELLKVHHHMVVESVERSDQRNIDTQQRLHEQQRQRRNEFFARAREKGFKPKPTTGFYSSLRSTQERFIDILHRQNNCLSVVSDSSDTVFEGLQTDINSLSERLIKTLQWGGGERSEVSSEYEAIMNYVNDESNPRISIGASPSAN